MKAIDLYDIILDGFVDVLTKHGVKGMSIPNDLTLAVAQKCVDKIQEILSDIGGNDE